MSCKPGISRMEVLAVLLVTVLLAMTSFALRARANLAVDNATCQANLRGIHGVLSQYCANNQGAYPFPLEPYYGWGFRCNEPSASTEPWRGFGHVSELIGYGASAEMFFCPFHPQYQNAADPYYGSWQNPRQTSGWQGFYGWGIDIGYTFLIGRGYPARAKMTDGRQTILANTEGSANTPIIADMLHYRNETFYNGWYHGTVLGAGGNTLLRGGAVVYGTWEELQAQGPGLIHGTEQDKFYFTLPLPWIEVTTNQSWVYQNTPVTTGNRHQAVLTVTTKGFTNYSVAVTKDPTSVGDVTIEPTADPLVWTLRGSQRQGPRGTAGTGLVKLNITLTAAPDGTVTCQATITSRQLGDIDGVGGVNGWDKLLMNKRLNGLVISGPQYNLDGGFGGTTGQDKLILNKILCGLPIP